MARGAMGSGIGRASLVPLASVAARVAPARLRIDATWGASASVTRSEPAVMGRLESL